MFLGLDIGTTGAKGVLIDASGNIIATATREYPLLTPHPGWAEQAPDAWWTAAQAVLKELVSSCHPERSVAKSRDRIAIGLTGQMHGAVFLDADGNVIRPALLWNDQRTVEQCREIERRIGAQRLREITGNVALAGFQAPKILWLRENEPNNYARIAHILLPKDFIRYKLTGVFATDASDASGTLLFDLTRRNWSDEILHVLDIPRAWLPQVYESTEVAAYVTEEAASLTGIPAGTLVVAGASDNAAAAVGAGVVAPGRALVSIGTSGVILAHTDKPVIDPIGALHAFASAVPGRYDILAVMLAAGGSLRWCRDVLAPGISYDALTAEASHAPAGSEGAFFLPYLAGERTPHMDSNARAAWIGLTLAHTRAHMIRSVLEGVAFGLRDGLLRILDLGVTIDELRTVGNGIKSPLWRGIIRDILNRPLRDLQIEEGPAFGAAILASVGAKTYPDVESAVDAMVRVHPTADFPEPSIAASYAQTHTRFTQLYQP